MSIPGRERVLEALARHEAERGVAGIDRGAPAGRIARYEIQERLGSGGAAEVFKAWDRHLMRPVALKILHQAQGLTPEIRARFRKEARALAELSHSNILAIHDAGEESGRPYLVVELIEGRPLSQFLCERRRSWVELVELALQVAEGVEAAHQKGIIHRDLKPSNILVTKQGLAKVADFGLAYWVGTEQTLTVTGTPLGTPSYMAPEQVEAKGDALTVKTDVYALGAVLYEILTGAPPHAGSNVMAVYESVMNRDPIAPRRRNSQIPIDLEAIAMRALEKNPAARYSSAREFADDLHRFLRGETVQARSFTLSWRMVRHLRRYAGRYALAASILAATAVSAEWWGDRRETAATVKLREVARTSIDATVKTSEGVQRVNRGQDPVPQYSEAEAGYRHALELDSGNVETWVALAQVQANRAKQRMRVGEDPRGDWEQAEQSLAEALRLDASHTEAWMTRASLLTTRGIWMDQSGGDPTAVYLSAERCFTEALARDGTRAEIWMRRGLLRTNSGVYQARVGENPLVDYGRAEADYSEALQRNPDLLQAWTARGQLRYNRANYRARLNRDALQDFDGAESDLSEALRIHPEFVEGLLNRGHVRWNRAALWQSKGEEERMQADLEAARRDYAEAVRLQPSLGEKLAVRLDLETGS